ncbi:hypothetical protein BC829DRAFT_442703 [Chytridium lagenaria]|nr:hypothetical protein BC829DRAFT_442703 [Chytridium lagenaria]
MLSSINNTLGSAHPSPGAFASTDPSKAHTPSTFLPSPSGAMQFDATVAAFTSLFALQSQQASAAAAAAAAAANSLPPPTPYFQHFAAAQASAFAFPQPHQFTPQLQVYPPAPHAHQHLEPAAKWLAEFTVASAGMGHNQNVFTESFQSFPQTHFGTSPHTISSPRHTPIIPSSTPVFRHQTPQTPASPPPTPSSTLSTQIPHIVIASSTSSDHPSPVLDTLFDFSDASSDTFKHEPTPDAHNSTASPSPSQSSGGCCKDEGCPLSTPTGFYRVEFDAVTPKTRGRTPRCREVRDDSIFIDTSFFGETVFISSDDEDASDNEVTVRSSVKRIMVPKPEPKKIVFSFLRSRRKEFLRSIETPLKNGLVL